MRQEGVKIMITIKPISPEGTWELRWTVMWPDKDIAYVKLQDDDQGIHYGLFEDELLVSVVSLFIKGKEGQFRKFATLQEMQGKGYGTKLLGYVMEDAKSRGVQYLWCNARKNKICFYKKFGLAVEDEKCMQTGVEYAVMSKIL